MVETAIRQRLRVSRVAQQPQQQAGRHEGQTACATFGQCNVLPARQLERRTLGAVRWEELRNGRLRGAERKSRSMHRCEESEASRSASAYLVKPHANLFSGS